MRRRGCALLTGEGTSSGCQPPQTCHGHDTHLYITSHGPLSGGCGWQLLGRGGRGAHMAGPAKRPSPELLLTEEGEAEPRPAGPPVGPPWAQPWRRRDPWPHTKGTQVLGPDEGPKGQERAR